MADDADRRAEELVTSEAFIAAASHMDTIAMEKLIAGAIRAERERVCAAVYAEGHSTSAPVAVAKVCDETLDRSGALLGRVRDAARAIREGK